MVRILKVAALAAVAVALADGPAVVDSRRAGTPAGKTVSKKNEAQSGSTAKAARKQALKKPAKATKKSESDGSKSNAVPEANDDPSSNRPDLGAKGVGRPAF